MKTDMGYGSDKEAGGEKITRIPKVTVSTGAGPEMRSTDQMPGGGPGMSRQVPKGARG